VNGLEILPAIFGLVPSALELIAEAGHEDHAHLGADHQRLLDQLDAVHARHLHIEISSSKPAPRLAAARAPRPRRVLQLRQPSLASALPSRERPSSSARRMRAILLPLVRTTLYRCTMRPTNGSSR
jgi:hypothetical protein